MGGRDRRLGDQLELGTEGDRPEGDRPQRDRPQRSRRRVPRARRRGAGLDRRGREGALGHRLDRGHGGRAGGEAGGHADRRGGRGHHEGLAGGGARATVVGDRAPGEDLGGRGAVGVGLGHRGGLGAARRIDVGGGRRRRDGRAPVAEVPAPGDDRAGGGGRGGGVEGGRAPGRGRGHGELGRRR